MKAGLGNYIDCLDVKLPTAFPAVRAVILGQVIFGDVSYQPLSVAVFTVAVNQVADVNSDLVCKLHYI